MTLARVAVVVSEESRLRKDTNAYDILYEMIERSEASDKIDDQVPEDNEIANVCDDISMPPDEVWYSSGPDRDRYVYKGDPGYYAALHAYCDAKGIHPLDLGIGIFSHPLDPAPPGIPRKYLDELDTHHEDPESDKG